MDEEGIPLLVVIGLIAVDGVEREGGDKLHTLPHHIGQTDVVGFVVIGCDGENAFGQGVHHILGGGLEDDVPDKVFWKRAVVGELGGKDGELRLRGKLTEEKQVSGLFKAEALFAQGGTHQVLNVIAAVIEFALAGDLLPVHHLF